jgi:hypothetical protein
MWKTYSNPDPHGPQDDDEKASDGKMYEIKGIKN